MNKFKFNTLSHHRIRIFNKTFYIFVNKSHLYIKATTTTTKSKICVKTKNKKLISKLKANLGDKWSIR